jgi:hypothetical protein
MIRKIAYTQPISQELLDDAYTIQGEIVAWMRLSPDEKVARLIDAMRVREQERAAAKHVDLTLSALLDKLGFSREYAEHLVQPYCHCGDSNDGWWSCQHAQDLRLVP